MTKKKFNCAKVALLIVICFGVAFFSINNSQALLTPYDITVTDIISYGPGYGTGYDTDYRLITLEFGELDAFCVESAFAIPGIDYELVDVPDGTNLSIAAGYASRYYDGSIQTLLGTNQLVAKVATQLAIWNLLGIASTTDNDYISRVNLIQGMANIAISDSVYLAQSPRTGAQGGSPGPSQDYLVSVPDASIMFLLGPVLLGLGLIGRRKFKK